jgi:hypothetical protein
MVLGSTYICISVRSMSSTNYAVLQYRVRRMNRVRALLPSTCTTYSVVTERSHAPCTGPPCYQYEYFVLRTYSVLRMCSVLGAIAASILITSDELNRHRAMRSTTRTEYVLLVLLRYVVTQISCHHHTHMRDEHLASNTRGAVMRISRDACSVFPFHCTAQFAYPCFDLSAPCICHGNTPYLVILLAASMCSVSFVERV